MLIIDILNGLSFPGDDLESVLLAALRRKKLLNPLLRKILDYAAKEPRAFQLRFAESLLSFAAYLLARGNDDQFLELSAPLIDSDADPNLLGYDTDDTARLLAEVLPVRMEELALMLKRPELPHYFIADGFDALVLTAHRHEECRGKVVSILRSFLRPGVLEIFTLDARDALVESCCRIDPTDFVIDFQFAIERGELLQAPTDNLISEARQRSTQGIWFEDWSMTGPLNFSDGYFTMFRRTFSESELTDAADKTKPDRDALLQFNSVAVPCRGYLERTAAITLNSQLIDVCTRVMRLVATTAGYYRSEHEPAAVSAAICLAAPSGDAMFARYFAAFLRVPEMYLEEILGDDHINICDSAFALSARSAPELIREIVEDTNVGWVSRTVAFSALYIQVEFGFLSAAEMEHYCRELVVKRAEMEAEPFLWSDVLNISSRLGLYDLKPVFLQMCREGFFTDERGDIFLGEEEVESEFREPYVDVNASRLKTTSELMGRSYDSLHRSVREFLGCLVPPDYSSLPNADVPGAGPES